MNRRAWVAILPLVSVLFMMPVQSSMVKQMDLVEMCQTAGRIFRGTVVDVHKTTVTAGGGEIPAITYRIDVSEQFKGASSGAQVAVTMVDLELIALPRLRVGQDYLLLTTTPSDAGLSTMVGLAQGTFEVYGTPSAELAVNGLNNAGLINGVRGPLPYQDLSKRIRAALQ